jgi:DNA mismatch repair protein MutS2
MQTSLDGLFKMLLPNKHLEEKINSAVINEEELSDNASPALYDIRKKIRIASSKARETLDKIVRSQSYQKILQDAIVTQRGGRYVVPVKAEFRGSFPGLVHDTSSSGATVFIEPMGVVQANNDIKVLQSKEANEIERILFELSVYAGGFADEINQSYNALVGISVVFAKAALAYKMKAAVPVINNNGVVALKSARHPLIDKDKVVPTDIYLGEDFNTLVITGPNTGGKTVSLKTLGLLTLMTMCGLMIPALESSKISVFNKILVDIGDEQSIEQSLSTFSAHITNIKGILDDADRQSLVLIDELGAGTDPVEGAALAISILEELGKRGAKIAATTHYAELKAFALETPSVENGACEFDVNTLRPTYRLLIGVPGRSNAFAISERLGISKAIINRAEQLMSVESRDFENVVKSLEERRQSLEEKTKQADEIIKASADKKAKADVLLSEISQNAEKEIAAAKTQAQKITERAKAQAYAILDALEKSEKGKNLTAQDRAKLKKDLLKMEDETNPVTTVDNSDYKLPRPLQPGDVVKIMDIDKEATVLEVSKGGKKVTVQTGVFKTVIDVANLRLLDKPQKQQPKISSARNIRSSLDKKPMTEIDLRGMTADEAIIETERALDGALLMNIGQISIIHGKGTGVLRSAVQRFLKGNPNVKSYRLGTFGEGESGVTIVEIKEK